MMSSSSKIKDILINKEKLVVNEFQTIDKDIVRNFDAINEQEIRKDRFEKVLKIGVIAIKTTDIVNKDDYIEKEFKNLNNNFSNALDSTIQELKNHFGEDGKVIRELFDPNKEGTPLYNLKNEIRNEIIQL